MKKSIFICTILLVCVMPSNAQIDILTKSTNTKPTDTNPRLPVVQYDSTYNYDKQYDISSYYGLKIYCATQCNTMRYGDQANHPEYYNLRDRYLTIIPNPDTNSSYRIALYDSLSGYSYIYRFAHFNQGFEDNYQLNYYFVMVAYYEKIKELYEGKDFIYVREDDNGFYGSTPFNGLRSRETFTRNSEIKKGTLWHCDGIGVDPSDLNGFAYANGKYNRVVLYLSNEEYGSYYCYAYSNDMNDGKAGNYILGKFQTPEAYAKAKRQKAAAAQAKKKKQEEERAKINAERAKQDRENHERLVRLYGQQKADMIERGEVAIGFTKAMCKEAWGSPSSVNTTENKYGKHEQWVYGGGRYLYFENGVLTTIQK